MSSAPPRRADCRAPSSAMCWRRARLHQLFLLLLTVGVFLHRSRAARIAAPDRQRSGQAPPVWLGGRPVRGLCRHRAGPGRNQARAQHLSQLGRRAGQARLAAAGSHRGRDPRRGLARDRSAGHRGFDDRRRSRADRRLCRRERLGAAVAGRHHVLGAGLSDPSSTHGWRSPPSRSLFRSSSLSRCCSPRSTDAPERASRCCAGSASR